jgi:hypothetical protein
VLPSVFALARLAAVTTFSSQIIGTNSAPAGIASLLVPQL